MRHRFSPWIEPVRGALPVWRFSGQAVRKLVTCTAVFLGGALLPAAEAPKLPGWRERMQPIVPQGYVVRRVPTAIRIDGRIDEAAWSAAAWTADFVDIEGAAKPRPRFRTRAKLLWDDDYLYVAAELEEPHVWGTLTQHDAVIFHDPDFEIFLDPDGDTHAYFEFELNALNTGWDLSLDKPYIDGGPARNEWEIPGLRTAVHIKGTLNQPKDTDIGWTLEMAFPWRAFATAARPGRPPQEGEQWRLNFSRVEWQIEIVDGAYRKIPKTPEDNWVWSPQGVVDMHRPEMWGIAQFTFRPATEAVAVAPLPGKAARDQALDFYYAQRDFFKAHRRWAATWEELGWSPRKSVGEVGPPEFTAKPDGYTFAVPFADGAGRSVWRIRQDRRLTLEPRKNEAAK